MTEGVKSLSGPPDAPHAFGWMAISAVLFGLMSFFARLSSAHSHWSVTAAIRALIGAMVAIGAARIRGNPIFIKPSKLMWLRSIFGTLSMGCTFYALSDSRAPLADAVTLANTTPLFLALFAPFLLNERSGKRLALALPLGAVGVLFVLRPTFIFGSQAAHGAPSALVPELIAVGGGMFSSFAMMSLRRASRGDNPEAIVVHFSMLAAVAHFAIALLLGRRFDTQVVLPIIATGIPTRSTLEGEPKRSIRRKLTTSRFIASTSTML